MHLLYKAIPLLTKQYSTILISTYKFWIVSVAPPENRPPEALFSFVKVLEQDRDLQSKIKAAENPQQIIDIAESEGFTISPLELRTWSKELTANSFPWATKGNDFRRNFFKRAGQ